MEAHILDGYVAPSLVPTIMALNIFKQFPNKETDILYKTVGFGTIISAIYGILQFHLRRKIRSRSKLTLLNAALLTAFSIMAIVGFNLIRVNLRLSTYSLPENIRSQKKSSGSEVFRYHFFADFIPGLLIATQSQVCSIIMYELMHKAKRAFTLGEASILAQLVSAAYITWSITAYSEWTGAGPFTVDLTTEIILYLGANFILSVCLPYYYFMRGKATIRRYFILAVNLITSYFTAAALINSSTINPFTWLVDYIFSTHQRISLFSLWLSTLAACVSFSTSWARMVGQTNSLVRKVFHLAICVVFVSGYNQDLNFTQFAAGGIVVVMIVLETIRASRLKFIGDQLENICKALRGKWDNKYLTLSHLYLLVGVFLPLWLLPQNSNKLALSAGLISVGVGDTAAAIIGTFLGKTKLRRTSGKSLEGLLGNIFSMLLFKIYWIGNTGFIDEFSFIMAAIFTALTEAITKTCDNLILPLVMILLIEIFHH